LPSTNHRDVFFSDDGSKFYIGSRDGASNNAIFQFSCSVAFDVTAAPTLDFIFDASDSGVGTLVEIELVNGGHQFNILNAGTKEIYAYQIGIAEHNAFTDAEKTKLGGIEAGAQVNTINSGDNVSSLVNDAGYVTESLDNFGRQKLAAFRTGESFTLSDFIDTSRAIDVPAAVSGANTVGVFLGDNGTKVYVVDNGNTQIIQFNLSIPYDLKTAALQGTFSIAGQDGNPLGMFLTADGTKLFVPGNTNDRIYEYTLSTAWDITSASFVQFISTLAQDASPQDVWVSSDGSQLFLVGGGTDTIYEYTLSTPNSLTGASYSGNSYSVTTEVAIPSDVYFSNDGLQMFVADNSTGTVFEYTLTNPLDISAGVSYSGNSIVTLSGLAGLCFDTSGSMFVVAATAADEIRQYETMQDTVGLTSAEKTKLGGIEAGAQVNDLNSILVAASDETTDLTTGTAKVTFRMPYGFTLSEVRASLTEAPTGGALQCDINQNGVSILSTPITIDATEKTSTTAATPPVISTAALADDDEITIDIDTVGATTPGKGLKITLIGNQ
jgi:sugar lactone lactonase YvrE